MRRLLIAALALAVLGSGSAVAAKKYVIDSKKDIAPKVRKALKGKRGKVGATGPQGAPGQAGPSNAIYRRRFYILLAGEPAATVVGVTLPAGDWVLQARTNLGTHPGSGPVRGRCEIADGAGSSRDDTPVYLDDPEPLGAAAVNMAVVGAADPQRSYVVRCSVEGGQELDEAYATGKLIATRVGALDVEAEG